MQHCCRGTRYNIVAIYGNRRWLYLNSRRRFGEAHRLIVIQDIGPARKEGLTSCLRLSSFVPCLRVNVPPPPRHPSHIFSPSRTNPRLNCFSITRNPSVARDSFPAERIYLETPHEFTSKLIDPTATVHELPRNIFSPSTMAFLAKRISGASFGALRLPVNSFSFIAATDSRGCNYT